MKKYTLVNPKVVDGKTLYQVKSLIDFYEVKAGDLGGWVYDDYGLDHGGNCWLDQNSSITGGFVKGDTRLINSHVHNNKERSAFSTLVWVESVDKPVVNCTIDNSHIVGTPKLSDSIIIGISTKYSVVIEGSSITYATLEGSVSVQDSTITGVRGCVVVDDKCRIRRSRIEGRVEIKSNALVENSTIKDDAVVTGYSIVKGSTVKDKAVISGSALVKDGSVVECSACVTGLATIEGKSVISNKVMVKGGVVTNGSVLKGNSIILSGICFKTPETVADLIKINTGEIPGNGSCVLYRVVSDKKRDYLLSKYNICDTVKADEVCFNSSSVGFGSTEAAIGADRNSRGGWFMAARIKLEDIVNVGEGRVSCNEFQLLGFYK